MDLRQEIQNLVWQLAVSNQHHDKACEDDKQLYNQDLANQLAASNLCHNEQMTVSNLHHDETCNELANMRVELSFLRSFISPVSILLTFFHLRSSDPHL